MNLTRNGQVVMSLATGGNISFAPFFQDENLIEPLGAQAFCIKGPDGRKLLASRQMPDSATTFKTDITLRGRFAEHAILPGDRGLRVRAPGGAIVAVLTPEGHLLAKGADATVLPNPGAQGNFTVDAEVYATPNLAYPPGLQAAYAAFHNFTSASWETNTVNLSGVFTHVSNTSGGAWPFTIAKVPLNGLVRIPRGPGPFPLIVFAHGNHQPTDNSTPGYLYLCDVLASWGVIAATIDVNFLNGAMSGEEGARALVHLEHVKLFEAWNGKGGHPLENKVDLDRIVIVGHSRGGEAVGHAALFNRLTSIRPTLASPPVALDGTGLQPLGPYGFQLRGLIAIAPTDGRYRPVDPLLPLRLVDTVIDDTSYLLMHGTKDADVIPFSGYRAYDRALPYAPRHMRQPAAGFKALTWIYGANHNYFNTGWGADFFNGTYAQDISDVLPPAVQRALASSLIGAWTQIHLLGRSSYWPFVRAPRTAYAKAWLTQAVGVVSQYHDKQRLWIQTFDNSGRIQVTPPVTGKVDTLSVNAEQRFLSFPPASNPPTCFLFQETGGLRVEWSTGNENYKVTDLGALGDTTAFQVLSFRVGQSAEGANTANSDQDFTVRVTDRASTAFSASVSAYATLPYPDDLSKLNPPPLSRIPGYERKMVMQTVRIPLSELVAAGLNPQEIRTVEFLFNVKPQGVLYVDDIQLSM